MLTRGPYRYWISVGFILGLSSWIIADFVMEHDDVVGFCMAAPIFLVGIALVAYGVDNHKELNSLWLCLVTAGVFPTLFFLFQYFEMPRCLHDSVGEIIPCTDFPQGYLYLAFLYGTIALVGVLWKVKFLTNMILGLNRLLGGYSGSAKSG